jgi:hypothetical protein
LFEDAQSLLLKIIAERKLRAAAVVGFWPANAVGGDIVVFADDTQVPDRGGAYLRQQMVRCDGRPNIALPDFVAPLKSGVSDYIGGFVVTAGWASLPKTSKRPTTTARRLYPRRSPIGSPNGCTNGCARNSEPTTHTSTWTPQR